ncbi:hypothetical protein BH11MYX1_BH11MYX1_31430 [soil metagenome]
MFSMRATLLGLVYSLAAACGPAHHTGQDDATAVLTIDPPSSELTITNAVPVTEDFTATLTYTDGTTKDVTAATNFAVDYGGNFSQHTLTALGAGKLDVSASYSAKAASATVIVHANGVRIDPTLPSNTQDLFNGPEVAALAPTVVYPPPAVVMPRNLGDFEIHWTDSSSNDIFEISLHTDLSDVRVYVPGGNGMPAAGPGAGWSAFLATEWQAAVGTEDTVTYQVRAVNSANPGAGVGAGPPRLVKLSTEAMNGGIYYWASAGTTSPEGIWRHDMAKPGLPAEQYMTVAQTNGRCVACHVISRDGTKMAITYDGGNGNANMIDVGTKALAVEANKWNFGSFTPDGAQYLSVFDGALVVRDYATQAILGTMPATGTDKVTHPDVSADGTMITYTRVPAASYGADWHFGNGEIVVRPYDQATATFGAERILVTDANNNYYPSFSPDGTYVLFNKSSDNSSNGAYNNPSATVWVAKTDGTGSPVELATLDAAIGTTNSWARWAPFKQTVGVDPIYWITTSSQRDFGTRIVGLSRPQIWMTAFSPAAVEAATDPSSPTFRLPFQNLDSNNHIAQWTEQIVVTQ